MSYMPFLGKSASFKEAYPQIASFRLTGTEHGEMIRESQGRVSFSENSVPSVIPCSNPRCRQGGFNIHPFVLTLATSNELSYEGSIYCNGHEGSPKGRIKGNPCFNRLELTIEVTYKNGNS